MKKSNLKRKWTACVGDDEGGFVDMQASNTTEDTPSEYMSTVCQSLVKLLGHSAQLLEFDKIRTSLKSHTVKLPSELCVNKCQQIPLRHHRRMYCPLPFQIGLLHKAMGTLTHLVDLLQLADRYS